MRKAYYSIGIFIAVFFLSAGFYTNYQVSSLKDRLTVLNRTVDRLNVQETDASGSFPRKDALYTFEIYDAATGKLDQQQFQVVSYSSDHIVSGRDRSRCDRRREPMVFLDSDDRGMRICQRLSRRKACEKMAGGYRERCASGSVL